MHALCLSGGRPVPPESQHLLGRTRQGPIPPRRATRAAVAQHPGRRVTGPRHWIGVVSRDHVRKGVAGGFAMLNHGKLGPLTALTPGDGLIFYSPKASYPDGPPLKAFTAIGTVRDSQPYKAEMAPGRTGFRRDIDWWKATETLLAPLGDRLEFTRSNWGLVARRGLFEINAADFQTIRDAMTTE